MANNDEFFKELSEDVHKFFETATPEDIKKSMERIDFESLDKVSDIDYTACYLYARILELENELATSKAVCLGLQRVVAALELKKSVD